MNRMKYIMVDNGMYDAPVIFDKAIEHTEVAQWVVGAVISAGFIRYTKSGMQCYGESIGLQIKSREEDSAIVNRMIGAPHDC